ncbi:MAG: OmpA family protein, partial [Spirochaetota bacterium]
LRIRIASIYFEPYTANYLNVEPDLAARNQATLDRLAEVLEKYPHHTIQVEGHAVQIYWYNGKRARTEHEEVLVPLSTARADAIVQALVERGVEAERMTVVGQGGALPIVPHNDLENRWKNRRVEFILERR